MALSAGAASAQTKYDVGATDTEIKGVPQLFAATGATRFTDPKSYPWTMGYNPNYQTEGRIYAKYILQNHPDAKIAILLQTDDLGRDYVAGMKAGLGDKAAKMIVSNVPNDLGLPGMTTSTSPTHYRVNKQLQMQRFNGQRWELFGPIIEDDANM